MLTNDMSQAPNDAPLLVLISNTFFVLRMFRRMEPLFVEAGYRVRNAADMWRTVEQAQIVGDDVEYIGIEPADMKGEVSAEDLAYAKEALAQDASRRLRHPRDPEAFARNGVRAVRRLMDGWKPSGLVFWNGQSFWHRLLVREANRRGIPICFMENGYFPGTVAIDAEGINYGSATLRSQPAEEYNAPRIKSFLEDLRTAQIENRVPPRRAKESEVDALLAANERKLSFSSMNPLLPDDKRMHTGSLAFKVRNSTIGRRYASETLAATSPELPTERTIFLPMQVANDTQITLYSPWIRSMEQLVDVVLRAMPEGYSLIVRDHPEDRRNRSYDKVIEQVKKAGAYWAPTQPLLPIIRNADAIVTVNSTVGFEGLLWNKPVVTLGQAFYEGPGGSIGAKNEDELRDALKRAVTEPVDLEARERLMSHVAFATHCQGGLGHLDAEDQREAVQWILKTLR